MTPTGQYAGSGALSGLTDAGITAVTSALDAGSNPAPTPDLLPVPTVMVAAQKSSSAVEPPAVTGPVGGSNPSVPATSGVEQWRGLVESIFQAADYVLRVIDCESDGIAHAHNFNPATGDDSVGLAQINLHRDLLPGRIALLQSLGYDVWDRESAVAVLKDPEANLRAAYRISGGGQSFAAWSCR